MKMIMILFLFLIVLSTQMETEKLLKPEQKEMTLLINAEIYTPEKYGKGDILFTQNKIIAISKDDSLRRLPEKIVDVVDMKGRIVVPGIVDVHVHAIGGGGELGPTSRTPEGRINVVIDAGVTTVVGLLGTDSVGRSEDALLMKLKALEEEGLSTWMWSGAYHVPPPKLTDSVMKDIMIIDKVIGFGEIAIADHRSSSPTINEIARLVSDARVGGMLSGKAGVTHFHVGPGKQGIDMLFDLLEETNIPISNIYPTHMAGRGEATVQQGKKWIELGGVLDFTACSPNETDTTLAALLDYDKSKVDLSKVTLSSDAFGSLPEFDSKGNVISFDFARPDSIFNTVKKLVQLHNWPLEKAIKLCTSNPGKFLKLNKGEILAGRDADLLILDFNLNIEYVYSKGKLLKTPHWTQQPLFPCL